tara:strand:+ start:3627 stop:3851 length:225 start_codon:yes stop_codon:yes gene_type:complete
MEVTRISLVTGITRVVDLPITEEQLINYRRGALIQDALWNLTISQREFFMTGITDEEWDKYVAILESDNENEAK